MAGVSPDDIFDFKCDLIKKCKKTVKMPYPNLRLSRCESKKILAKPMGLWKTLSTAAGAVTKQSPILQDISDDEDGDRERPMEIDLELEPESSSLAAEPDIQIVQVRTLATTPSKGNHPGRAASSTDLESSRKPVLKRTSTNNNDDKGKIVIKNVMSINKPQPRRSFGENKPGAPTTSGRAFKFNSMQTLKESQVWKEAMKTLTPPLVILDQSKNVRYQCTLCELDFTLEHSYNRHYQRTHMGLVYKCGVCSRNFSRIETLKEHDCSSSSGKTSGCQSGGSGAEKIPRTGIVENREKSGGNENKLDLKDKSRIVLRIKKVREIELESEVEREAAATANPDTMTYSDFSESSDSDEQVGVGEESHEKKS